MLLRACVLGGLAGALCVVAWHGSVGTRLELGLAVTAALLVGWLNADA